VEDSSAQLGLHSIVREWDKDREKETEKKRVEGEKEAFLSIRDDSSRFTDVIGIQENVEYN
jgi:hypothetical protein